LVFFSDFLIALLITIYLAFKDVICCPKKEEENKEKEKKEEEKKEEEKDNKINDNFEDLDFENVKISEDENNKKECNNNCCECSCNEEIFFALTFFGRLILTFYSFYGLFLIYNFIIQFIILIPGILYEIESFPSQILLSIIYISFAMISSNILIIPVYDFLLFPFLRYRNVIAHLESFNLVVNILDNNDKAKEKINLKKSKFLLDILLIILEISYIISYILGVLSLTNKAIFFIDFIILLLIHLYYLIIILGYILVSIYFIIKLIKHNSKFFKNKCYVFFFDLEANINDFFCEREPFPKINLFCYSINPILYKSYIPIDKYVKNNSLLKKKCCCYCCNCFSLKYCKCEECEKFFSEKFGKCYSYFGNDLDKFFYSIKLFLRIILFLGLFIIVCILIYKKSIFNIIFFLLFFICMFALSLRLSFPYILRNKRTFGEFFSPDIKYNKKYKLEHPKMISFIRLFNFIIILFVSFVLVIGFFKFNETKSLADILNYSFSPSTDQSDKKNLLLPNICFSSLHNLKIHLYMPFINDAYYYDDDPGIKPNFYSSFQIKGYKELFFDSKYEITVIGNLINSEKKDEDHVKMVQYNVKNNESKNELTILSIKGTSNKKDMYLDFQLYFPSILLNLLSTFSLFGQQKDTLYFQYLEYSLSVPYRLFSQYLIIDKYLNDLLKAYNDNKGNFKSNVIIVGHSLGGGLCKLLGRLVNKQAISLSGPGVNAFHSLWGYEGNSENFEISAIDLVPDMDLVPRVEVSGGTVYRIICKEGPVDCHSKNLSLCEVLIMCRNPNYEEYCKKMAGLNDEQIELILKSSKLNDN